MMASSNLVYMERNRAVETPKFDKMVAPFGRQRVMLVGVMWACTMVAASVSAQAVDVAQHTEGGADAAPEADETKLNMSAGGTLSTGNTQSWQANAGADFRLVRGPHATAAMVNFLYGRSDLPDDDIDGFEDTARNLNAKARYDHFLTDLDALFGAAAYRWDTFAGLETRIQLQAGYLRNFVREDDLRFWGELGYDLTYDNYTLAIINAAAADGNSIEGHEIVHSLRGFVGYDNHITDALTWNTGLEGLMNVEEPEDFRVNWNTALRSKINGSLQLEMKFALKYDNVPVPGTRNLDTLSQVSLIYGAI